MQIDPQHPLLLQRKNPVNELSGYWVEDEWVFGQCPLVPDDFEYIPQKTPHPDKKIRFYCLSASINAELKYACWKKLDSGQWIPKAIWMNSAELQSIIDWLNETASQSASLLNRDIQQLVLSFRSYLAEKGKLRDKRYTKIRGGKPKEYFHESTQVSKLRQIYKIVEAFYAEATTEYEKDVWDLRTLGIFVNPSQSAYILNFKEFRIPWLKRAVKSHIRYSLSIHSAGECQNRVATLRRFSRFLSKHYPAIHPEDINRELVLDYLSDLAGNYHSNTRSRHISQLRTFLELCTQEGWANVPDRRLIYREDFPKYVKAQPRYIPEGVMEQLNENLDGLSPIIRRMVLILQECGMRIGELCRMPRKDCLLQDAHGDWFLRYYQYKMKKEHSIPITREVAALIQQQQREVDEEWGTDCIYLFPTPKPHGKGGPLRQKNFSEALNRLAHSRDIRGRDGQIWHFQAHQFRHTVGTRMINNKVPQHIIQRFLGHESPTMTATYATIHDETLKKEFEKFMGSKIVDVKGCMVTRGDEKAQARDLQWFKKHVLAQALPNGSCALPTLMGSCPHANACLTCTHFRTDARFLPEHKKQLDETDQIIETAQDNGWTRQVEMNLRVKENLTRIIVALEEESSNEEG